MKKKGAIISNLMSHLFSGKFRKRKKRPTVGGWKKATYHKIISKIASEASIGFGISEHAIISKSAIISESATICAGAYIGDKVIIGNHSIVYPNAVIMNGSIIGEHVIIGPGVVIGDEGFGFFREKDSQELKHLMHIGKVVIEDHVHIGSLTDINRGSLKDTMIGEGTKINCNVHIAHNVQIGRNCMIMAAVSISGSTRIGDNTVINPMAAVSKHVTIGDNAVIGMNSTVIRDVKPGTRVLGSPAKEK